MAYRFYEYQAGGDKLGIETVEVACKRGLAQKGIMGSPGFKLWTERRSVCFCERIDKRLRFTMEEMLLTSCVILPTFEDVVQCGLV